ncbi:uncharacterized protein LOC133346104 isoform X3 [Lethenteron reissneri]|nr:uncharacterized protein LOC133346104 isoform X3 [Lethenteron reissneri]XP_061413510.1 uncharacterized protein LOC133346104 isoform X3 [Lethenteron reissneri]XP_061413520.1 uncharacterized protein LOC133346104 isoform X3 [Lethenteron reissneri]
MHVTAALMTPLAPSHSHPHLLYLSEAYGVAPGSKPHVAQFNSLKRLAEKEMSDYYSRKRHLAELASGTLPLHLALTPPLPGSAPSSGGGGGIGGVVVVGPAAGTVSSLSHRPSPEPGTRSVADEWARVWKRNAAAAAAASSAAALAERDARGERHRCFRAYGSTPVLDESAYGGGGGEVTLSVSAALVDSDEGERGVVMVVGGGGGGMGGALQAPSVASSVSTGATPQSFRHRHHQQHTWRSGSEKDRSGVFGSTPSLTRESRTLSQRLPNFPSDEAPSRYHSARRLHHVSARHAPHERPTAAAHYAGGSLLGAPGCGGGGSDRERRAGRMSLRYPGETYGSTPALDRGRFPPRSASGGGGSNGGGFSFGTLGRSASSALHHQQMADDDPMAPASSSHHSDQPTGDSSDDHDGPVAQHGKHRAQPPPPPPHHHHQQQQQQQQQQQSTSAASSSQSKSGKQRRGFLARLSLDEEAESEPGSSGAGPPPPPLPPRLPARSGSGSGRPGGTMTPDRVMARARRAEAHLGSTPSLHKGWAERGGGGGERGERGGGGFERAGGAGGGASTTGRVMRMQSVREVARGDNYRTWSLSNTAAKRQAFAGRRHMTLEHLNYVGPHAAVTPSSSQLQQLQQQQQQHHHQHQQQQQAAAAASDDVWVEQ